MLEADSGARYALCFGAGIDGAGGAATTSFASDTVAELADETILASKFCTPGGVGGEVDDRDAGEVEVELEHDKLPDLQPVNWCRTMNRNYIRWVRRSTRPSTSRSCASAWISMARGGGAATTSLASNSVPELADETSLTSKLISRVRRVDIHTF